LPFDGPKTVTDVAGGAPRARQWRGDACGASAPLSGGMAGSEPGQPIGDVDAGGRHLVECAAIRSYAAAELTRARAREHVAVLLRTRSTGLMSTRFNARSNPRARSCRRAGVGLGLDADAAGVINATRRTAARPITASVRFDLMPLLVHGRGSFRQELTRTSQGIACSQQAAAARSPDAARSQRVRLAGSGLANCSRTRASSRCRQRRERHSGCRRATVRSPVRKGR
jgi:hypothetical protein